MKMGTMNLKGQHQKVKKLAQALLEPLAEFADFQSLTIEPYGGLEDSVDSWTMTIRCQDVETDRCYELTNRFETQTF